MIYGDNVGKIIIMSATQQPHHPINRKN